MSPAERAPRASAEEAARTVVEVLCAAGHVALWAGGSVRDRLLGRPASDVDVATSAQPAEVRDLFRRTLRVGEQFGIVIVLTGGQQVEVATFRADGTYLDGRRPSEVEYTDDPRQDARRRDFTVNGLFYDPLEGRLLDYVEGQEDLERGLIRAIGAPAERFREDKLRILRAPRFAAVLGFRLEERTAEEARRHAGDIATAQVSQERIRAELEKILAHPNRARGVGLCHELGILEVVLPEAGRDPARSRRALAALPAGAPLPLAWAALLEPAGPGAADAALRRLRCSNKQREAAAGLLADLEGARTLARAGVARQKRLLRVPHADDLAELLRAAALAGDGDLEPYRYYAARRGAFGADPSPAGLGAPPLIGGKDLKAAGLRPGRHFARILAAVEDAQLEGRVADRGGAIALATDLAASEEGG